jgi:hypothetical protein
MVKEIIKWLRPKPPSFGISMGLIGGNIIGIDICGNIIGCCTFEGAILPFGGVPFNGLPMGNWCKEGGIAISIGFGGAKDFPKAGFALGFAFGFVGKANSLFGLSLLEKASNDEISSGDIGFPLELPKGAREG